MSDSPDSAGIFECASCGNIGLGDGEMICCDRPMEPVRDEAEGPDKPSFDELMRVVFDMSETELDICLCVMEGGEQTVKELAERIENDRGVVSRHLNHLVDLGVVEKRRRILEEGGTGVRLLAQRARRSETELDGAVREVGPGGHDGSRIAEPGESRVDGGDRHPGHPWKIYREENR